MEALIVVSRCSQTKGSFGIRMQRNGAGSWLMTWAFKLSEKRASEEGYGSSMVSGSILTSNVYPGCPYCSSESWVQCGRCGKLTCHHYTQAKKQTFTCAYCGNHGEITIANSFDINASGF